MFQHLFFVKHLFSYSYSWWVIRVLLISAANVKGHFAISIMKPPFKKFITWLTFPPYYPRC